MGKVVLPASFLILAVVALMVLGVVAFSRMMPTPTVDINACMTGQGTMEVGAAEMCVDIKLKADAAEIENKRKVEEARAQQAANAQWEVDTRSARSLLYHAIVVSLSLLLIIVLPVSGAAVGNFLRVRSNLIHAKRGLFPIQQFKVANKLITHNPNTGDTTVLNFPTVRDNLRSLAVGSPPPDAKLDVQVNTHLLEATHRNQTAAQIAQSASYSEAPRFVERAARAELPKPQAEEPPAFDISIVKPESLYVVDPTDTQHLQLGMDDEV